VRIGLAILIAGLNND